MFDRNSKVTINNVRLQQLYGVKPDTEFEVEADNGHGQVKLSNGWTIRSAHLNPVVTKPVFNLADAVDEQIAHFIDEDYAFTAYDVTTALRSKYPGENVPHWQVRDIVPNVMEDIDTYERKLVDIAPPGQLQPWLYYPEGYAPETYKPNTGAQVLTLVSELEPEEDDAVVFGPAVGVQMLPQDVLDEIEQAKQDLKDDEDMPFEDEVPQTIPVIVANPVPDPSTARGGIVRKFLSKFRI